MTETVQSSTKKIIQAKLKNRYAAETRFRLFGIAMATVAILAALVLLVSIFIQAMPSFTESRLKIDYPISAEKVDPTNSKDIYTIRGQGDFGGIVVDQLVKRFPNSENDGGLDTLMDLVSQIATGPIAKKVSLHQELIGKTIKADFALDDDLDMFLKGGFGRFSQIKPNADLTIIQNPDNIALSTKNNFNEIIKSIPNIAKITNANGMIQLSPENPSVLIFANGGAYKVLSLSKNQIQASQIITPNKNDANLAKGNWSFVTVVMPEDGRPIDDLKIAYGIILKNEGFITQRPNFTLFTNSDSNDAEMAGLLSAIVGSFFTLIVTFSITVPIGIFAAIYLEEFAPKNIITDIIEVNINNLAAVPSIVFGLLGFSVFLHFFGMPRSAPIVGGIVLALMSLPVIIIASRAALKAVPPSIREAALGVGASKVQAVFHHVLPLATPGMMTGSILAMAHALGETAPLLMIGMVAFIADVPHGFNDASTVLPVEIFMWAGRPERAWDARTSAAIIILLLFMILMNLAAVTLRRKFEKRW